MSERRAMIVCCQKLPTEERNIYRENGEGFFNIAGADDEGGEAAAVGEWVYYTRSLTDREAERFRAASNCEPAGGYLEEDAVDTEDGAEPAEVEGFGAAADVELPDSGDDESVAAAVRAAMEDYAPDASAAVREAGVDPACLRYLGLYDMGSAGADGRGTIVAVGDTGSDAKYYSESLKSRFLAGRSWYNDSGLDRRGHGTHVQGCATPSGANWIFGKVLSDSGSGNRSGIIAFIRWAADYIRARNRPGVINLSLSGGTGVSQAYRDAIRYANARRVIVVGSAGNNGRNAGAPGPPGTTPEAVQSAAVNHRTHRVADFSSYPVNTRACATPGVSIVGVNGTMSGTSFSAPLTSRVLAALLSDPATARLTIKQVEDAVYATCDRRGNTQARVGHGIVRGMAALNRVRAQGKAPAPTPTPTPEPEPSPAPSPTPEPEQPKRVYRFTVTETGQILALSDPAGVKRARDDLDRLGVKYRVEQS